MRQKLLRVNLSDQSIKKETIPEKVTRQYLGGVGFITYYLYKEVGAKIDPLSAGNKIIIAPGPAQGTIIPITGRYSMGAKSPLTGLFLDTSVGGFLGPEIRFAGYDLIIVEGVSPKPVYISIKNDKVEIKDASSLWGKYTHETEDTIRLMENEPKMRVMSIGPAGENKVKISCVTSDRHRNAGRGGLGAVFGSKKLKAIAVRGTSKPTNGNKKKLEEIQKDILTRARRARRANHLLYRDGTSWLVGFANKNSQFPTRNFQTGTFEKYPKIDNNALAKYKRKKNPCYRCIIACTEILDASEFEWTNEKYIAKPEYETLGLIGGNCGIDDIETIIKANYYCNQLGLDTISTGNIIGMIMEGVEKGIIKEEEYQHIRFGEKEVVIDLIFQIAKREGIGDIIAEGIVHASKIFNTEQIAVHSKGLPFPAWDPRGKLGLGLSYASAAVGASHLRGWPATADIPNKSAVSVIDSLVEQQDLKTLKDCLTICHFTHSIDPPLNIDDTVEIVRAVTNWKIEKEEVVNIAKRIWIVKRLFNIREYENKKAREYDILPPRFMVEPIPEGRAKGMKAFISEEDFNVSLSSLYSKRGLNEEGEPLKETLKLLEIDDT